MKILTSKKLFLGTTLADYEEGKSGGVYAYNYFVLDNEWNNSVYRNRIAKMPPRKRQKAEKLREFYTKCAAIYWSLLDMPLLTYGTCVKQVIDEFETESVRKCLQDMYSKWGSKETVRNYIKSLQVFPHNFDENMGQKVLDEHLARYGL